MNRREAIVSTMAATLALTAGRPGVSRAEDSRRGIVDVHAHIVPAAYMIFLKAHGVSAPGMPPRPANAPVGRPMSNPGDAPEHVAARLREMDEADVAVQILSPTITPFFADKAVALQASRIVNDAMITVAEGAPDRFRVFAVLPIPHIDAAQDEARRLLNHPLVTGITLSCFYGDRSAADPYFEPLYAELNREGTAVFFHPAVNGLCSRFITDWKLTAAAGPTFEDSVIAMHLIVAGIPARYPDLRIIVPHLGGGLSTLVARLDNQLPFFTPLTEPPSRTARRFWYDTCCHGSRPGLRAAVEAFGPGRLLPGSDWPTLTLHESYRETLHFIRDAGLPADDVEAILERNAEGLFGFGAA